MVRRHIHYEAAFEDYIRSQRWPYVAVDEAKRALFANAKVKSFDFLVYREAEPNWLVDVKGRQFPYETQGNRRTWENWVTQDDLHDLGEWQSVFGSDFEAVFVFAYWLGGEPERWPFKDIHTFGNQHYAFCFVRWADYKQHCTLRSPGWNTVTVPVKTFRQIASPVQ